MIERKWIKTWLGGSRENNGASRAFSVMIPSNDLALDLENARLAVMADFFCTWQTGKKPLIMFLNAPNIQNENLARLGLFMCQDQGAKFDLGVIPRDFPVIAENIEGAKIINAGRLLPHTSLEYLLPDFGGDVLRLYFLYLGPPDRDYKFEWINLAGVYKFAQKVWHLGRGFTGSTPSVSTQEELVGLEEVVNTRIEQKKPHTALAAIMEFLKDKKHLSEIEILMVAKLLKPYTPFLSAELVSFISSV
ncbi:MAG TPA: hypothetical protein GXZ55_10755 [Natronincola sp.]|nr:hypothetical protein [Natronincola sp.]